MPLFTRPTTLAASHIPLKANLDDMISCTNALSSQLVYIVEDAETYGVLSIDTYLENAPEVIKNLEKIATLVQNSISDLTFDDEVFEGVDEGSLSLVLYSFLSEYRRTIDTLAQQSKTLKTTGPLFDSVSRCLNKQRRGLDQFRSALELKYVDMREKTESDWTTFNSSMEAATAVYPLPIPVSYVESM